MIEGGRRDAGPFGKRGGGGTRAAGLAGARRPADAEAPSAPERSLLSWALRTAALVGLGAVLVAQILVRQGAPGAEPPRMAEARRAAVPDPETTGAIGPAGGDRAPVEARCGPLIACLRAPPARPRS